MAVDSRPKVLVLEDHYLLAADLSLGLQRAGLEVIGPLSTLDEALALAGSAEPPDAAVLDLQLHGEMAYPVADVLLSRGIPFAFVTGYDDQFIADRYSGVCRWQKPCDADAIGAVVSRLLRERRTFFRRSSEGSDGPAADG